MRVARFTHLYLLGLAIGLAPSLLLAEDKPADGKPEQSKSADAKPADAQQGNAERETLFKKLDANGDGVVSSDEVNEDQKRLFTRLLRSDKNEDGKLSLEEFLAGTQEDRPVRRPEGAPGGEPQRRPPDGGDPRRMAEGIFKQLDANGDGKVTIDEVPAERRERIEQMIQRADSNGDKVLTLEEFSKGFMLAQGGQPNPNNPPPQGRPPMPGEGLMRLLDTDNDGRLSTKELASAGEVIKKLDRNEDGEVSREELAAGLAPPGAPQPGAPQTARPQNPQPGTPPQGRFDPKQMLARLKEQDKNGDGKWSKDELPERMAENFARMDTNNDGFVDEAELTRAFEMMARFAGGGQPGQPGGGEFLTKLLNDNDKNADGKLSKEEAPERMKENFDRLDRNSDGFIDREELSQLGRRPDGKGDGPPRRRPDGDKKEGDKPAENK